MAHESFEDSAIAQVMNESFVPVKVDREERPDVDEIYMAFVQATTGAGGWPLTVFVAPDRTPFFGGTYFPPEDRWGRPGFPRILAAIATAWKDRSRRSELLQGGIRANVAIQFIIPVAALQGVRAIAATQQVVAVAASQFVVSRSAIQSVSAAAALQGVRAAAAPDGVAGVITGQCVRVRAADNALETSDTIPCRVSAGGFTSAQVHRDACVRPGI